MAKYPSIERLRKDRFTIRHGPVKQVEIGGAEAELGVRFPDDYRRFLAWCGWAELGAGAIFGLGKDVDQDVSVVHLTQSWRRTPPPRWHNAFVPLFDFGNGDMPYLQCLEPVCELDGSRAGAVFNWLHESDQHVLISPTFDEWVGRILSDRDRLPPFE